MTPRERFLRALGGESVDRRPTLGWPADPSQAADALVVPAVLAARPGHQALLAEVLNPFGRMLSSGMNPNAAMIADPAHIANVLNRAIAETRSEIEAALARGADGFLYRLHGARANLSTPMQYGGHFLEPDRELLAAYASLTRAVFVVGESDVFLDFVSDLPAELFAWDVRASGVPVSEVRAMRTGALAAADPDADVELSFPGDISPHIELRTRVTHA